MVDDCNLFTVSQSPVLIASISLTPEQLTIIDQTAIDADDTIVCCFGCSNWPLNLNPSLDALTGLFSYPFDYCLIFHPPLPPISYSHMYTYMSACMPLSCSVMYTYLSCRGQTNSVTRGICACMCVCVITGGKRKTWRRRWFILTDNCLYYFQSPKEKEPRGIIPLVNLEVNDYVDPKKQKHVCVCMCIRFGKYKTTTMYTICMGKSFCWLCLTSQCKACWLEFPPQCSATHHETPTYRFPQVQRNCLNGKR